MLGFGRNCFFTFSFLLLYSRNGLGFCSILVKNPTVIRERMNMVFGSLAVCKQVLVFMKQVSRGSKPQSRENKYQKKSTKMGFSFLPGIKRYRLLLR